MGLKDRNATADGNNVMLRALHHRTRPRFAPRVGAACLLVMSMVATLGAGAADPAGATAGDEASFVASLNAVRAGVGLPALAVNNQLANLSRGHAQVMADAGEIFHADPISAGYGGAWSKIGENVGVGASVSVLVDAFVASPGHYANIVDPAFTQVGVGVVWIDGALYTTHRFLQVPGESPTTTTTTPPPTTAPPTAPPTTSSPTPAPTTTSGGAAPPPTPTQPPAPPTSTTLPPLRPPSIEAARVVTLLEMVELVGT